MLKNIFFDLDGTLLPMDVKKFVDLYIKSICKACCPYVKLTPEVLSKAIFAGVKDVYANDGTMTNKMKFWTAAAMIAGPDIINHIPVFNGYYENEFIYTKEATDKIALARDVVTLLRNKGYNLVLATNPLFPKIAVERRVRWAGLDKSDFSYITSYETSKFCKPNPEYFAETLKITNCLPEETLMVGNDVDEDLPAERVGIKTYLVTDYMVNRNDKDYSNTQHGTFEDFYKFCVALPDINK